MQIRLGSKGTSGGFDFEALRCLGVASMGGAGVGECLAAVGRVRRNDTESWTREFATLAERLATAATTSLATRDAASAGEQFMRASTYYRVATFYLPPADPRLRIYRRQSRDSFRRALALRAPHAEAIAIPFEGSTLPGYFVSAGNEPRPTLLVLGGFDSSAEELMQWIGLSCAQRGWNALVFEGPGQPGAMDGNPGLVFRPDYEAPVGAVVDHVLGRRDVDPQRIALLGYSFGGYLAPRAAARDPRIHAVIANTIGVDIAAAMRMAIPSLFWKLPEGFVDTTFTALSRVSVTLRFFLERAREAFGVQTPSQFLKVWEPYNLWSVRDELRAPLLVVMTEDEIAEAPRALIEDTLEFLQGLPAPATFRVFTRATGGSAHCQLDSPELLPPLLFPWLNDVCPPGYVQDRGSGANDAALADVRALIRKHHGQELARRTERATGLAR